MADTKTILELPESLAPLTGTERVESVVGGVSVSISAGQIAALASDVVVDARDAAEAFAIDALDSAGKAQTFSIQAQQAALEAAEDAAALAIEEVRSVFPSPLAYGAVGDSATNDSGAFSSLESELTGMTINLGGRTYMVGARPTKNNYVNGFFLISGRLEEGAAEIPAEIIYVGGGSDMWASYPAAWTFESWNSGSAAVSRNSAPSPSFGAMVGDSVNENRGFSTGFLPVPGDALLEMACFFASTGTVTQGTIGFIIESVDASGVATNKKLVIDYVATAWKKKVFQYRLPIRTAKYRIGLYREASAGSGRVFFTALKHGVAAEKSSIAGGSDYSSLIDIKRDQATLFRLMDITRIGASPTTAFQGFAQIPGSDQLFISSGHEVVPGSGIDALVVEVATRGETATTTTEYQDPLTLSTGHAGLSVEYIDSTSRRLWSGGASGGSAVRFKWGGSAAGGGAELVEQYQLFDSIKGEATFPTVSYDHRWLVAVGRSNTNEQSVRVWRMEDLAIAGDHRYDYVYEWSIPLELIGDNFPIQGLTCDGGNVFILTGGFSPGTAGSIKLGQFTIAGDTVSIIRDVRVGYDDWTANGASWEPEGLGIYCDGPSGNPRLAIGMLTGSGATKHHTIWVMGGSGPTLSNGPVTVKKSNSLPGFTAYRDNSASNSAIATKTTAGSAYQGTGNGANFFAGPSNTASGAWLYADATTVRAGSDNVASCGSSGQRFAQVYAVNGTINTSDEREKTEIIDIPNEVLDAWATVRFKQFRWKDAIAAKGGDARLHAGVIAQQVRDAFVSAGIDPFEYGLLCYDEWGDTRDDDGYLVVAAGDRYAIRYEEALILESALMRRATDRLEARLSALEPNSSSE